MKYATFTELEKLIETINTYKEYERFCYNLDCSYNYGVITFKEYLHFCELLAKISHKFKVQRDFYGIK